MNSYFMSALIHFALHAASRLFGQFWLFKDTSSYMSHLHMEEYWDVYSYAQFICCLVGHWTKNMEKNLIARVVRATIYFILSTATENTQLLLIPSENSRDLDSDLIYSIELFTLKAKNELFLREKHLKVSKFLTVESAEQPQKDTIPINLFESKFTMSFFTHGTQSYNRM